MAKDVGEKSVWKVLTVGGKGRGFEESRVRIETVKEASRRDLMTVGPRFPVAFYPVRIICLLNSRYL